MIQTNHDNQTLRITKSPMLAIQPSKAALRDEIAQQMAEFERKRKINQAKPIAIRPYLETPRKPLPEWEAAKAKRAKERERLNKKPEYYTQPEMMAMFRCERSTDGYKKFDRMIERGDLPQPDVMRSVGQGRVTKRWKRERLDSFMRLREMARKHA